jgi:hypothetical protein
MPIHLHRKDHKGSGDEDKLEAPIWHLKQSECFYRGQLLQLD